MGGIGSGRRLEKNVLTVSTALRLDLQTIRQAVVSWENSACTISWCIRQTTTAAVVFLLADEVFIIHDGIIFRAALTWQAGRFGGRFPALLCPGCARTRRSLYLAPDLRCRDCHQLGYASQRTGLAGRAQLRMAKTMAALGASNIREIERPKHMRRRRYLEMLDMLARASATTHLAVRHEIDRIAGTRTLANEQGR